MNRLKFYAWETTNNKLSATVCVLTALKLYVKIYQNNNTSVKSHNSSQTRICYKQVKFCRR